MSKWGQCAAIAAVVLFCQSALHADYLTVKDPIFSSPLVSLVDQASTNLYGTGWTTYDPHPRVYQGYLLNVNDIVWQNRPEYIVPDPSITPPPPPEKDPYHVYNLISDPTITSDQDPDPTNWPYQGCASLSSTNGNEFFQNLTSVFQANKAYQLTAAIGHSYDYGDPSFGPPPDSALCLKLFYTDAAGRHSVISRDILNNASNNLRSDYVADFSTDFTSIAPGSPAVGLPIGILLTTVNPATGETSGFFNVTNVRVEEVPEPASLAIMLAGTTLFLRRRRRS